jgi:hypothetical protein
MVIGVFELLFIVVILAVMVIPLWCIVAKTGMPGVLSLLFLVPGVNVILLLVLAFSKWPIERRLEEATRGQH